MNSFEFRDSTTQSPTNLSDDIFSNCLEVINSPGILPTVRPQTHQAEAAAMDTGSSNEAPVDISSKVAGYVNGNYFSSNHQSFPFDGTFPQDAPVSVITTLKQKKREALQLFDRIQAKGTVFYDIAKQSGQTGCVRIFMNGGLTKEQAESAFYFLSASYPSSFSDSIDGKDYDTNTEYSEYASYCSEPFFKIKNHQDEIKAFIENWSEGYLGVEKNDFIDDLIIFLKDTVTISPLTDIEKLQLIGGPLFNEWTVAQQAYNEAYELEKRIFLSVYRHDIIKRREEREQEENNQKTQTRSKIKKLVEPLILSLRQLEKYNQGRDMNDEAIPFDLGPTVIEIINEADSIDSLERLKAIENGINLQIQQIKVRINQLGGPSSSRSLKRQTITVNPNACIHALETLFRTGSLPGGSDTAPLEGYVAYKGG